MKSRKIGLDTDFAINLKPTNYSTAFSYEIISTSPIYQI